MTPNINKAKQKHLARKAEDIQKISWVRREKDIYDQYLSSYTVAKYIKFVPALISVCLAASFLFYYLEKFTGNTYLSAGVAVVLLVILEGIKHFLLERGGERYFQKGVSQILMIALIPISFSILSSALGVQVILKEKTEVEHLAQIKNAHQERVQTINKEIALNIASLKEEKKAFKEDNTIYLGNGRYVLNNAVAAAYVAYNDRIDAIKSDAALRIEKSLQLQEREAQSAKAQTNTLLVIIISISLFVEFLIVALNLFIVWFEVATKEELDQFEVTLPNGMNVSHTKKMFDQFLLANMAQIKPAETRVGDRVKPKPRHKQPQTPPRPVIGFRSTDKKPETKATQYLQKHKAVVDCIKMGLTESDTLKRVGVSRSTYYNVKRVFDNLALA